jgi:CelD/BcsL family acetyltransferase involved in cellulose biosynthesis
MAMEDKSRVSIHIGNAAQAYLCDDDFQSKWRTLYSNCPWATPFQDQGFVLPWYELYREQYFPVVVFSEGDKGEMTGLLTLALAVGRKSLVAAGDIQAEYQCWLEVASERSHFMQLAMMEIKKFFPGMNLRLRYLPSKAPLDWLDACRRIGEVLSVKEHVRPLTSIDESTINKMAKSKNFKRKRSKLKRHGDLQFESLAEYDRFLSVLDEMCIQYDFRLGAKYNVMPFTNDPLKKRFLIELHRRGLLHASVLRVGGKLASWRIELQGNEYVHLMQSGLAPGFENSSPGEMHFFMLCSHFFAKGLPLYDLTPGGESYKDNLSTHHDVVYEFAFYASYAASARDLAFHAAKWTIKAAMRKTGVSSEALLLRFGKLTKLKQCGLSSIAQQMIRAKAQPVKRYRRSIGMTKTNYLSCSTAKDNLADLIRFDSRDSLMTQQEFLNTAGKRLAQSMHAYTCVKENKLLLCCWLTGQSEDSTCMNFSEAGRSALLYDFYVHSDVQDENIVQSFIEHILSDLSEMPGVEEVCIESPARHDLERNIRKCGFVEEIRVDLSPASM